MRGPHPTSDAKIAEWVAHQPNEPRLLSFAGALNRLPSPAQVVGPPRTPAAKTAVARLLEACPLYPQLQIVAFAEEAGCRERLAELIGPLPEAEQLPLRRPKEPIF